jgi:hypothetical protein
LSMISVPLAIMEFLKRYLFLSVLEYPFIAIYTKAILSSVNCFTSMQARKAAKTNMSRTRAQSFTKQILCWSLLYFGFWRKSRTTFFDFSLYNWQRILVEPSIGQTLVNDLVEVLDVFYGGVVSAFSFTAQIEFIFKLNAINFSILISVMCISRRGNFLVL